MKTHTLKYLILRALLITFVLTLWLSGPHIGEALGNWIFDTPISTDLD